MALAALLTLLGACSSGAVTENDCNRAFAAICTHQVGCELAYDFQTCDLDLRDLYICDFDRTKDEFQACSEARETSCNDAMAEACYEIVCSKSIGCIDTEPADTATNERL